MTTFGTHLRGIRLGYGLWKKHGMYVRISEDKCVGLFLVEMVPEDKEIKGHADTNSECICWWDKGPDLLESSPGIVARAAQGQRCSFFVGDDGEEVRS